MSETFNSLFLIVFFLLFTSTLSIRTGPNGSLPPPSCPTNFTEDDLRCWREVSIFGNAQWELGLDGTSVLQRLNSEPTFLVSPFSIFNRQISVILSVQTNNDDDFVGFAIGVDDITQDSDFLLLDWKKVNQFESGLGSGRAGIALSRVTGSQSYRVSDFWGHTGNVEELLRLGSFSTVGWRSFTEYTFKITFTPTQLTIVLNDELLLSTTVQELLPNENEFKDGSIAFYNYSQERVRYSQTSIIISNEPVALDLVVGVRNKIQQKSFSISASDENGDILEFVIDSLPQLGILTLTGNDTQIILGSNIKDFVNCTFQNGVSYCNLELTYTTNNFTGIDSFIFRAKDEDLFSNQAIVNFRNCADNSDCDDQNECTVDICNSNFECTFNPTTCNNVTISFTQECVNSNRVFHLSAETIFDNLQWTHNCNGIAVFENSTSKTTTLTFSNPSSHNCQIFLTNPCTTQQCFSNIAVAECIVPSPPPTISPTAPSYSTCNAHGDPHWTSFDGVQFHYQGECTYYIMTKCFGSSQEIPFNILSKHELCRDPFTCIKYIRVELFDQNNTLIQLSGSSATYFDENGVVSTPISYGTRYNLIGGLFSLFPGFEPFWEVLFVSGKLQFNLYFDLEGNGDHSYPRIMIRTDDMWFRLDIVDNFTNADVCGICGSFDKNPYNDFTKSNGEILSILPPDTSSYTSSSIQVTAEFGDSWVSLGFYDDPSDLSACLGSRELLSIFCSNITNLEIIRTECNSAWNSSGCGDKVDYNSWFEGCIFDTCACVNTREDLVNCTILSENVLNSFCSEPVSVITPTQPPITETPTSITPTSTPTTSSPTTTSPITTSPITTAPSTLSPTTLSPSTLAPVITPTSTPSISQPTRAPSEYASYYLVGVNGFESSCIGEDDAKESVMDLVMYEGEKECRKGFDCGGDSLDLLGDCECEFHFTEKCTSICTTGKLFKVFADCICLCRNCECEIGV